MSNSNTNTNTSNNHNNSQSSIQEVPSPATGVISSNNTIPVPISNTTAAHNITNPTSNKRLPQLPVASSIYPGNTSSAGTYASMPNETAYMTTHYVETPPESPNLQLCWQYGKTIKCISIIDMIFIFFNALICWPVVIMGIFPLCGYYGSKQYNVNKTFVYLAYCILRTISIIIQLYYSLQYDGGVYDDDDTNTITIRKRLHSDGSQFFLIFSIFVQLWITWIVVQFIRKLRNLTRTQLNTLRIGTYIPIQTHVLYY